MASNTENLNLLMKNPSTDGADTFNVQTMLNENWQKIDNNAGTVAQTLANILKPTTPPIIGLPPSTTPDGMFQALGNTGELHVWRKTVKNAADVPAGYTMGAAQEVELIKGKNNSGSAIAYRTITVSYSASVTVSDDGKTITLVSPSTATIRSDYPAEADAIKGKFFKITQYQSTYVDVPSGVNFVPSSATFANVYPNSNGWTSLTCSAMQTVTGYAKIPAGTTTTYPVSTNPNAYQEGDDAKEAGYTLGEVVSGSFVLSAKNNGSMGINWKYSDDITVSDAGMVELVNPYSATINAYGYASNAQSFRGKFVVTAFEGTDFIPNTVCFIPAEANIAQSGDKLVVDRYQPVTGYAAIPASTTIEYLGKLGDKARVQVVSYVGTGTYGSSNPNSLTFDFVPNLLFVMMNATTNTSVGPHPYANGWEDMFIWAYGVSSTLTSRYNLYFNQNGKTMSWYSESDFQRQCNWNGVKYTAVAIG